MWNKRTGLLGVCGLIFLGGCLCACITVEKAVLFELCTGDGPVAQPAGDPTSRPARDVVVRGSSDPDLVVTFPIEPRRHGGTE